MTNPKCLIKIDCARGKFEPCPTMTNCAATNKLLTTILNSRILRDEAMKALEDIFPEDRVWDFVTTYPFFGCVEEYDFNWYAENIDWEWLTLKLVEYRRYNKI